MANFSEFVVDGVIGDIYDKTAVHTDQFEDNLDDNIDAAVIALYVSLGAVITD